MCVCVCVCVCVRLGVKYFYSKYRIYAGIYAGLVTLWRGHTLKRSPGINRK